MFKGKQGIQEDFSNENEVIEYLKMITDQGYKTRRNTPSGENELADNLFKAMYAYNMNIAREKGLIQLPN